MTEPVKSVHRTISILELFARTRRSMTLSEIAGELDLPVSSAQDVLRSLSTLGYLSFDRRNRAYLPTLRVSVLGDWIEQSLFGQGHYRTFLRELRDQTGETVGIGCESDIYVQFMQVLTGTYPLTLNMKAGVKTYLCTSAAGRALLSARPVKYAQTLLMRHNRIVTDPLDHLSWSDLESALDFVRENGYAVSRKHTPHGLSGIGMMIPKTQSNYPVVVVVTGPTERINQQESKIVELMVNGLKSHF